MGFPRQDYWSWVPFLSPGDRPTWGLSPGLLHWQADFLPLSHQGSPTSSERQCSHLTKGMSHSTTHPRKEQETAGGQEGGTGDKNAVLNSLITRTRRVSNLGVGGVECSCLSCAFFTLLESRHMCDFKTCGITCRKGRDYKYSICLIFWGGPKA